MIKKKHPQFRFFLLTFFIFFIFICNLFSQNKSDTINQNEHYSIGLRAHYGYIMLHRETMQHLSTGFFTTFELNIDKQTFGKKAWQQLYKYPSVGISLWRSELGSSPTLGSATAIFPYINFPLIKGKNISFNFRFGTGLGYLSKCFDRINNYKNVAIGSHINAHINLLFDLKVKVSSQIDLSAGFNFAHFSNGAFKVPNLGINIPSLNMSLNYHFNKSKIIYIKQELPQIINKNEFFAIANFGAKEIYPIGGQKYLAYVLSFEYSRVISNKTNFGAGIDFSYNTANLKTLETDSTFLQKNKYEIIRPGINLEYQLKFSKLSLIIQLGRYLYARDKSDGYFYDRLALRYAINKHVFANLSLRTHFAKADFVECGIGYKL